MTSSPSSVPSSSPSSPSYVSYVYSASCSDRQFCLTGLHQSLSEQSAVSKGLVARKGGFLGAVLKMTSQRQYSETGSDSDSGKGTVLSDTLESPMRDDSPITLSPFPPNNLNCYGDDPTNTPPKKITSIEQQQQQRRRQQRRIRYSETTTDDNDDDGCPTSPAFPVDCSFHTESPVKTSCSSEESGHVPAGYGSVCPVDRLRRAPPERTPDGDVTPEEERNDAQYNAFDQKIQTLTDNNNNNNNNKKKKNKNDDLGEFSSMGYYGGQKVVEGQVSGSGKNHLIYGETKEATLGSINNLKANRPLLKAKCQALYEARNNGFGSREICPREAPGRRRGDHHDRSAGCSYGPAASRDARLDDAVATSCRYVTTDCFYDDRQCDVNYGRQLTLSDSLSAVYDRPLSPSTSGGEAPVHGRLHVRQQVAPHPAAGHWDSPSRGAGGRYAKRPKATAAVPPYWTLGSDSRLHGGALDAGAPRPLNPSEYRRARSTSYEGASSSSCSSPGAAWMGGDDPPRNPSRVLGLHPAMQQAFLDDTSATYPRPNKTGSRAGAGAGANPSTRGPVKDRRRRRTNSGTTGEESGVTGTSSSPASGTAPHPPQSRWTRWLSLSSMLKPKRHGSTTSLASGTKPETGFEMEEGGVGGGSAVTSTRPYSSSQSVDRGATSASASTSAFTSASVPTTPTKTSEFLRSSGSPYPGDRTGSASGISFLQKIRSRLTVTSKTKTFTSSTDDVTDSEQQQQQQQRTTQQQRNGDDQNHVTRGQNHSTMIGRNDGMGGDSVPVAKATKTLGRFISLQESSPVEREPKGHVTDFATLQMPKGKARIQREYHADDSTSYAGAEEASAKCATKQSEEGEATSPGEVTAALLDLDEFASVVTGHATSSPNPGDRTIREDDFNGYRRDMIDSLKEFIDQCRLMVVKAPASRSDFLDELSGCRCLLGGVLDSYRALVDCTSLPADRARFAGGVGAVAASFRGTVVAASEAAGRRARHPTVRRLRSGANRLVADLTDLMKLVREMNYNRLSRRF